MRTATAAAATCCLLCLAWGCAPEPPAKIQIGLLLPLDTLPEEAQAAELAVEEINSRGGITVGGVRTNLELKIADTQRLPQVGISGAYELIREQRVVALLGVPLSHVAIPVARIAEANEIPMISTRSSHPETTAGRRFAYRLSSLDALQAEVLAEFAAGELGARRAALLADAASSHSMNLTARFRGSFEALGGEIVANELFTVDTEDIVDTMRRLSASRPDVVLLPYLGDVVMEHMHAARAAGLEATLLGGDSWGSMAPEPPPLPGPHYFVDAWAPDRADPLGARFVRTFVAAFGSQPTSGAALTYDAVYLLHLAIERAQATEPEAIRLGLETITDFQGVTGRISFAEGHDPRRSVFLRCLDDRGERHLVRVIGP